MHRIVLAIGLFAALAAFILYVFAGQSSARIKGQPEWLLVAIPDAQVPPATVKHARRLLAEQPLDQATLNLVFAAEVRAGMPARRRDLFGAAIADLGWRDTPSQQNLIIEAARTENPRAAVLRADALLRRGKLIDGILPILVRLESFPEAADLLIERLSLRPAWRQAYFRLADVLRDPATLDARVQLFDRIFAENRPVTHVELKPTLDALMRADRRADAAQLALRASGQSKAGAPFYDPEFKRMMALTPSDRDSPLPFEWETYSRPGLSAQIAPRGDAGQLQIRWNGVGAPIFARTMVLLAEVDAARLYVVADDRAALSVLAKLGFGLACPGKGGAAFVPDEVDQARNTARFRLSGAPPCAYPDFVVMGRPQASDASVETSINSIRLVPR